MTGHLCIDCKADPPATVRKIVTADGESKRCTTHLRRFKTRQRQQARGRSVERTYDISAADNGALLVFQGGRCWICRKATGASKLLATDHDHADNWVRGRLCSTCNQFIGRQLSDDPNAAARLVQYLSGDTPYRRMLAVRLLESRSFDPDPATVYVQENVIWFRRRGTVGWSSIPATPDDLASFATPKDA